MRKRIAIMFITGLMLVLSHEVNSQVKNPKDLPWEWRTDTLRKNVDLSEVLVVLPKGAFPVVERPKFVVKEEGLAEYFAKEPVISVELEGKVKAYPLNILTAHGMVNDSLSNIPILVTYCPLCNSALVFDRRVKFEGKEFLLKFEVSGLLRYSNMIIFDRQTESWWQQIDGRSIAGLMAGTALRVIPSMIISVADYFNRYPEGKILSKNTGIEELQAFYGTNPYEGYDDTGNIPYPEYFDSTRIDPRLPPMERVINIESKGSYKLYPFSLAADMGVINDSFNGKEIVIFHMPGTVSAVDGFQIRNSRDIGSATAFDALLEGKRMIFEKDGECFRDPSGSCWDITGRCIEGRYKGKTLKLIPHGNHFAFAWLAFYPQSEIYDP